MFWKYAIQCCVGRGSLPSGTKTVAGKKKTVWRKLDWDDFIFCYPTARKRDYLADGKSYLFPSSAIILQARQGESFAVKGDPFRQTDPRGISVKR